MRAYVIDDLTFEDSARIRKHLDAMELGSGMDGLYWLPVPLAMLNEVQVEHQDACGPFCMALETTEGAIRLELLVRARNMLRCACVGYASTDLERHMIDYVDNMLRELGIPL